MNEYLKHLSDDSYVIYLLHGVISKHTYQIRNYNSKHILKQEFNNLLRLLTQTGNPVSMDDIVTAHTNGTSLPKKSFAVTFDDGFENNFHIAAPLLEEYKVPATFYITTGFIESNSASWIDQIEFAFEALKKVSLRIGKVDLNASTQCEKIEQLNYIRQHVKNNPELDPYKFAGEVMSQLSVTEFEPDQELDQKMAWEQIKQMSRSKLFTIGGHSHTHRILSFLPINEMKNEIVVSLEILRAALGIPIEHYSYPEGMENCYNRDVITVLKNSGIKCSPSAEPGLNKTSDDLFTLKRIAVT